jgi:hypothetical protein
METTPVISKKKRGEQLLQAERNVLISKLIDKLCEGYTTTHALSKELRVSRDTIDRYRAAADEIIRKFKLDRNVIRNLQVKRTYKIIEQLMEDLKSTSRVSERTQLYNQIYKFSSHLALITGLNVETTVHVDPTKLVIIRANHDKKKQPIITVDDVDTVNSTPVEAV